MLARLSLGPPWSSDCLSGVYSSSCGRSSSHRPPVPLKAPFGHESGQCVRPKDRRKILRSSLKDSLVIASIASPWAFVLVRSRSRPIEPSALRHAQIGKGKRMAGVLIKPAPVRVFRTLSPTRQETGCQAFTSRIKFRDSVIIPGISILSPTDSGIII